MTTRTPEFLIPMNALKHLCGKGAMYHWDARCSWSFNWPAKNYHFVEYKNSTCEKNCKSMQLFKGCRLTKKIHCSHFIPKGNLFFSEEKWHLDSTVFCYQHHWSSCSRFYVSMRDRVCKVHVKTKRFKLRCNSNALFFQMHQERDWSPKLLSTESKPPSNHLFFWPCVIRHAGWTHSC